MTLHGFEVEANAKIVPDYILMNLPRREVMYNQIDMSYRGYLNWKLEVIKEVFDNFCGQCWKDRTNEDVQKMNYYTRVIRLTENILNEIKKVDNLEIEKQTT